MHHVPRRVTESRKPRDRVKPHAEIENCKNNGAITPVSIALFPGRKWWFLRYAAAYFRKHPCRTLYEAFSGSAVVGMTLLYAGIVDRLVLVERDERVACMLNGILNDRAMADKYEAFECTRESVQRLFRTEESAFSFLVQTRVGNRGKLNGGLRVIIEERWCRRLVANSIRRIQTKRDRIEIINGDGVKVIQQHLSDPNAGCFADPPYPEKGKSLYGYVVDHPEIFSLLAAWHGPWLLTEDTSVLIRRLVTCYRFSSKRLIMNTADHQKKSELMIWRKRKLIC